MTCFITYSGTQHMMLALEGFYKFDTKIEHDIQSMTEYGVQMPMFTANGARTFQRAPPQNFL